MSASSGGRLGSNGGSHSITNGSARSMIDTPTGRGCEGHYRRSIADGIHRWVGWLVVAVSLFFGFVLIVAQVSICGLTVSFYH